VAYQPSFDLERFNFVRDLKDGEEGEAFVTAFLRALSSGAFEVKTDRYRNGRMVIETHQAPMRALQELDLNESVWKPSGLNVTTAKWWIYVYALEGESGAFVAIEVGRLKRYLRKNSERFNGKTKKIFAAHSDNPSRGWLLEAADVFDLLTNPVYD
jgi:hypothetical protein